MNLKKSFCFLFVFIFIFSFALHSIASTQFSVYSDVDSNNSYFVNYLFPMYAKSFYYNPFGEYIFFRSGEYSYKLITKEDNYFHVFSMDRVNSGSYNYYWDFDDYSINNDIFVDLNGHSTITSINCSIVDEIKATQLNLQANEFNFSYVKLLLAIFGLLVLCYFVFRRNENFYKGTRGINL